MKPLAPATVAMTLLAASAARAQVAPPAPESIAVGDWRIAPLAEARVRGEYRHDLDGGDHAALVERTRLGADAERGAVEMRVVLQDARLWDLGGGADLIGQPSPLATTGAYEAWVEAHAGSPDRVHPSFLRVGRQAVTWGEGRLLGASDWSATARSLDALRGRLALGDWRFELLAASLSDPVPPSGLTFAPAWGELAGARAEWAFDPLFAVEAYVLGRFAQGSPAVDLDDTVRGDTYTGALRLHGKGRAWTWGAEGAYQLGRVADLAVDREAWAAAGHVAYTFEHVLLLPTLRAGASYASGDDGGTRYHAFDPLLPDVHTWMGAMDLFAWSNEAEAHARAAIAPWADAVAAVEYRYAALATPGGAWRSAYLETIGVAPGNRQTSLGHEVDATIAWSPWVPVELSAGYSVLALGDGARAVLAAERLAPPSLSHFAYGQLTARLP